MTYHLRSVFASILILYTISASSQYSFPLAFNGSFSGDYYKADQRIYDNPSDSGIGVFMSCEANLNITPLYYISRSTDSENRYKYAIGLRTGITRWVLKCDFVDDYRWYLDIYPIARLNFKKGSFIEVSAGASLTVYERVFKQQSGNIWAAPFGRVLLWQTGLSFGHDFHITDKVYFEPMIGLEYQIGGALDNPVEDLLKHDQEDLGVVMRLGFMYRLYE